MRFSPSGLRDAYVIVVSEGGSGLLAWTCVVLVFFCRVFVSVQVILSTNLLEVAGFHFWTGWMDFLGLSTYL